MNVLEALSATVQSAINLRIITLVGDAPITGSIENPRVAMPGQAVSMVTNINLVEGDVSTLISQPFLGGEYAELRALHAEMAERAHKVIERNLAILQEILEDRAGRPPGRAPAAEGLTPPGRRPAGEESRGSSGRPGEADRGRAQPPQPRGQHHPEGEHDRGADAAAAPRAARRRGRVRARPAPGRGQAGPLLPAGDRQPEARGGRVRLGRGHLLHRAADGQPRDLRQPALGGEAGQPERRHGAGPAGPRRADPARADLQQLRHRQGDPEAPRGRGALGRPAEPRRAAGQAGPARELRRGAAVRPDLGAQDSGRSAPSRSSPRPWSS